MDKITALVGAVAAIAGFASGFFGAEIWQGQYGEAREDLGVCEAEKADLRDAHDDLRDSLRSCTDELLDCDPRAGRIMLRERAVESMPDVAAPPPER